jgi:opacity protein-like surface antigen
MEPRTRVSVLHGFRLFSWLGAGFAVAWLVTSFLVVPPAPAKASDNASLGSGTVLKAGTFGSISDRPLRRHGRWRDYGDYDYDRHNTPYGFLNIGGGMFDPQDQPGNGFYGNLAVGTEAVAPLDLGVQLSWYHRGSKGEEFVQTYTDPAGNVVTRTIETESVDTDLIPLMGIARLRFPISPYFQPYVGGGAGFEWLFVDGTDALGDFSEDFSAFGAQVMGGVNIGASRNVALYGEGIYNFSHPNREVFDPDLGATVKESVDMDGFGLHGGLRLRF